MENTDQVRIRRSEQDIETLRKTQSAMLDRYDTIYKTLVETRDIAAENRERLERVEERLELVEEVVLENRALIEENRAILVSIAEHLGLTWEKPSGRGQSD